MKQAAIVEIVSDTDAVVSIDCELRRLYLITIYEPDPEKWSEDFDRRK